MVKQKLTTRANLGLMIKLYVCVFYKQAKPQRDKGAVPAAKYDDLWSAEKMVLHFHFLLFYCTGKTNGEKTTFYCFSFLSFSHFCLQNLPLKITHRECLTRVVFCRLKTKIQERKCVTSLQPKSCISFTSSGQHFSVRRQMTKKERKKEVCRNSIKYPLMMMMLMAGNSSRIIYSNLQPAKVVKVLL